MEQDKRIKSIELTIDDLNEFMTSTGEEQWKILLSHAKRNQKIIQIRRLKTMEHYNDNHYEEISKQFEEFCHTKGIVAKFKVAFGNMAENARKQKEADKARFEEIKHQSAASNREFTEFLHTKGFRAKVKLIISNLKKGCQEASHKTALAVENISTQTKASITKFQAGYDAQPNVTNTKEIIEYSPDELTKAFNAFLKEKGLDGQYAVEIIDEKND